MAKLIIEMEDAEIYQKLHKMGYHGTAGKYSHSELGHEIDINHPHGMKMTYHDPVGRKQEKFFKNKVDLLKHIDSLKPSVVGPSGNRAYRHDYDAEDRENQRRYNAQFGL